MTTDREPTLDEWMGRLPRTGYANRELAALRARCEALEGALREIAEDRPGGFSHPYIARAALNGKGG